MKILGVERNNFATNHYRVVQPLQMLMKHGLAEVSTFHMDDLKGQIDRVTELVVGADVVLIYSPSNDDWLNFMKICRQYGKTIVADYDDDPFNVSPWNPAYRHIGIEPVSYSWPDGTTDMLWSEDMVGSKGEKDFFNIARNIRTRDLFAVNFKKADLVTTTTDVLSGTLQKMNPNVAVLPNLINLDSYPRCEFVKRGIRIGWQGGSSHYEDIWSIVESVQRILEKYRDAKFIYLGDLRLAGVFKRLPQDQVEYHGWVSHAAYSYKLATLNLDIGLCPLADNTFNRNKSAIKWMEYSAVGAATVASNIPPYSPVIKHGENGILVSDDEWFMAIESLVLDENKRRKMAENAYADIETNHNADLKAHLWVEAYERLLKTPVGV